MNGLTRILASFAVGCCALGLQAQPDAKPNAFEVRRAESKAADGLMEVVVAGTNIATLAKDTSPGIVLALAVLVEVAGHTGAKLVGPLPKELQVPLPYSAVLGARPVDDAAAAAFLQLLASPEAKQAYAAAGFEVK